MKGINTVLKLY